MCRLTERRTRKSACESSWILLVSPRRGDSPQCHTMPTHHILHGKELKHEPFVVQSAEERRVNQIVQNMQNVYPSQASIPPQLIQHSQKCVLTRAVVHVERNEGLLGNTYIPASLVDARMEAYSVESRTKANSVSHVALSRRLCSLVWYFT